MQKPIAIDLFAGAGGLSEGFRNAGFRIITANEKCRDAIKTYTCNHPETEMITGEIQQFSPQDILKVSSKKFDRQIKREDIDVVIGGPPCQGLSTYGEKNQSDPRNILIFKFIEFVKAISPKAFVMENVPGLLTMYNGEVLEQVIEKWKETNYEFKYDIVPAIFFGVPQLRRRTFFIGFDSLSAIKFPSYPKSSTIQFVTSYFRRYKERKADLTDFLNIKSSENWRNDIVTVGDAISDLENLKAGEETISYDKEPESDFQREMRKEASEELHNHVATKHKPRMMKIFSYVRPGHGIEDIPEEINYRRSQLRRWHPDEPSRAITTEPVDNIHYLQNRIATVREIARLQTFPDHYMFLGQRTAGNIQRKLSYCSQTQQVGNAVPPRLAEAIAISVKKMLGY